MKYYISDLHLFCLSQLKGNKRAFDERPFESLTEMHEYIVKKWNSKITNMDKVYILGDVAMRGKVEGLIELLDRLKGRKILIRGNHDELADVKFVKQFDEICDYKEISDKLDGKKCRVILSHYPILMWNGQHSGSIHLYGHTHTSKEDDFYKECINKLNDIREKEHPEEEKYRAYNVGCMQSYMGYEPRTLSEIVNQ